MNPYKSLAIIGTGPSAIFLLQHILTHAAALRESLDVIHLFESSQFPGRGMPYSPATTDRYNMSNISSEEFPKLPESLVNWLRAQDATALQEMDIEKDTISEDAIYERLVLGKYLHAQYKELIKRLTAKGFQIEEHIGCRVSDIHPDSTPSSNETGGEGKDRNRGEIYAITIPSGETLRFSKVVLSTGHQWEDEDRPDEGYYASPWPIAKLLPREGELYNFPIGMLGASLSAFDVLSSLAHRHGDFVNKDGTLVYEPRPGTEKMRFIMHAKDGLLPHLQFVQVEPMREIYRHVSREALLSLRDRHGYLRLHAFFDQVCRPTLIDAFEKDGMPAEAQDLRDPDFTLEDFVKKLTSQHKYVNPFEGMRKEYADAKEQEKKQQPFHWKEALDDLLYTLNFHAELMPAEDHMTLHSELLPFVMNVIAAMPLCSAEKLLALYDAGKVELVEAEANVTEEQNIKGKTLVTVKKESEDSEAESETEVAYRLFIDCGGQKPVTLEDFPFQGLVQSGLIRKASAPFADGTDSPAFEKAKEGGRVFSKDDEPVCEIGGVEVTSAYALASPQDGRSPSGIHDIAFAHIGGLRPYSYGLQACNETSRILVESWLK